MTHPFHRTTFPLIAALALASGFAAAAGPLTPLGTWMKQNMGTPFAGGDFALVASNADLVATKQPSADYAQWSTFAKAVSAAAGKKDNAGVKAACKQCHDTYKEKYKKEFPTKAFP